MEEAVAFSPETDLTWLAPGQHGHDVSCLSSTPWPDDLWEEAERCTQCATRLLLLLVGSSRWMLRRVERVSFHDDRTAHRRVSMDFLVPGIAPRFRDADQTTVLLPLTMMRRKTLVNFGLSGADGSPLPLLSMRQNQRLTEQMLLVLGDVVRRNSGGKEPGQPSPAVCRLAHDIAFGDQAMLEQARETARRSGDEPAAAMVDQGVVSVLVDRFVNSFMVLAHLDVEGPSRRIVRMSYDEPLTLRYRLPPKPERPRNARLTELGAALGWKPTSIRFPTPAAENTQSYHFEVEAPPGVRITSASMVADPPRRPLPHLRPGEPTPSWDHVSGGFPIVGLHVCDVPNGSKAEAQVNFRLMREGWLDSSLVTTVLGWLLLLVVGLEPLVDLPVVDRPDDTVMSMFFSVTGAAFAVILGAQEHRMASKMLTRLRWVSAIPPLLLFLVVATTLFSDYGDAVAVGAAVLATVCLLLIVPAWRRARARADGIVSPWEQGDLPPEYRRVDPERVRTLQAAREFFGFDAPSIRVESSEGEHLHAARWTVAEESQLTDALGGWLRTEASHYRCGDCQPVSATARDDGRTASADDGRTTPGADGRTNAATAALGA